MSWDTFWGKKIDEISWVSARIENTEILHFLPVPNGVAYQTKPYELTITNTRLKPFLITLLRFQTLKTPFALLGFIRSLMDKTTIFFTKICFTWWVETHFEKNILTRPSRVSSRIENTKILLFFLRHMVWIRAHESTFTNDSVISFLFVQLVKQ